MSDNGHTATWAGGRDYVPAEGDRVTAPISGETLAGSVVKGGIHESTVQFDNGRRMTLLSSFLEPSDIPVPDHVRARTFRKGDRVEFDHWSGTRHGVVARAGKVPRVYTDGRTDVFDVSPGMLRHSDVPVRRDPPHPMDAWSVADYSHSDAYSLKSRAYIAKVALDGVPVLQVIGSGLGDPTRYGRIRNDVPKSVVGDLESAARQWLLDHGMPEHGIANPADVWVEWKAQQAPYGITAADLVERLTRDLPPAPETAPEAEADMGGEWEFDEASYGYAP